MNGDSTQSNLTYLKTLNIHSLSKSSEFLIYLNPSKSKIPRKCFIPIKIIVNTGLYKRSLKINKSLLEKDLTSVLSKMLTKYFSTQLNTISSIDFYITIIKYSKYTKQECLNSLFWSVREFSSNALKILCNRNFFSIKKKNGKQGLNSFNSKSLKFVWLISIVLNLHMHSVFYIISQGLISINLLIRYIFYVGNFKWIINLKKNISL